MSQRGAARSDGDEEDALVPNRERWGQERSGRKAGSFINGQWKPAPPVRKSSLYGDQGVRAGGQGLARGLMEQERTLSQQNGAGKDAASPSAPPTPPAPSQAAAPLAPGALPRSGGKAEGVPQPESPLVTLVRTEAEAVLAVARLSEVRKVQRVFAVDTETSKLDVKEQSPCGNGTVCCFSIYAGPQLDFKGCGETISLDVPSIEREYRQKEAGTAPAEGLPEVDETGAENDMDRKSTRLWVKTDGEEGQRVLEIFKPWLENPNVKKVFHNWSFDFHVLANHGVFCRGLAGDTVLMARLWDSNRAFGGGYKLSSLCHDLLGWGKVDMKIVFSRGKLKTDGTEGRNMYLPDSLDIQNDPEQFDKWVHYATFDTLCTWHLYHILRKKLEEMKWAPDPCYFSALPGGGGGAITDPSLTPVEPRDLASGLSKRRVPKGRSLQVFYTQCWLPFAEILSDMERKGVAIDIGHLREQAEVARGDQAAADRKFRDWARSLHPDGEYINTHSVIQKRHVLFGTMKVRMTRDFTHERSRQKHPRGAEVELAWRDGEEVVRAGAGERVSAAGDRPGDKLKTFTIENKEGFLLAGRTKPLSTREISLGGLWLEPTEYTATGKASTSGPAIGKLAGDPFSDPPRYGTAYEGAGGGEEGRRACEALFHLLEVERISQLLNNFLETLPKQADPDGRIHTSININTETGRLSSKRPNLQNQPALEKDIYKIRKAFTASAGNRLIVVDYGQLELRIMAHMARCSSMIDAFAAGGDFHSRTALDMYPYIQEAVAKGEVALERGTGGESLPLIKDKYASERRKAKTLNFSIAYGKTKHGLAKDWGVSATEAQATIDAWFAARHEVKDWQDKVIAKAQKVGYTETLLGRRRTLPLINSKNTSQRFGANRAAINTPIQGGAADIVVMAMIRVARSELLRELGWHMVLQVHDELILEGPADSADKAFQEVKLCMEHPLERPLLVELPVDGKIVDSWYDAK